MKVKALALKIHDETFGYLIGFNDGKNILYFDTDYRENTNRKTLSLLTYPPINNKWLSTPKKSTFILNPFLSNLLPEGSLRTLIASNLKILENNEFEILSFLGNDLPGAISAIPITKSELPKYLQFEFDNIENDKTIESTFNNKFSLAGVQMKYSMIERGGRFTIGSTKNLGDWIIKTPSSLYKHVPENEYSCMKLAESVGIDIPEVKLIDVKSIDNIDNLNIPNEKYAYAIKRFDRNNNEKIHIEDFAQILYIPTQNKYNKANYFNIGKLIYNFSHDAIKDIQQYMRQLLVNILLANGDAHVKNWSMIYTDDIHPRLSPAYDIVSTIQYIDNDSLALNFAKTKNWYEINLKTFENLSEKIGVPWRSIKPHLNQVIETARESWKYELDKLPMIEEHKIKLVEHWNKLDHDFRIN